MSNFISNQQTPHISLVWPWDIWTTLFTILCNLDFGKKVRRVINSTHCLELENWKIGNDNLNELILELVNGWKTRKEAFSEILLQQWEKYDSIINCFPQEEKGLLIDTSNWDEGFTNLYYKLLLDNNDVVTANKNPFIWDYNAYKTLIDTSNFLWKGATVMAWWNPIMDELSNLKNSWEKIVSLEWCFSWTLGYITSELEKWRKFSEILKEAIEKGFTEPNPWYDLNGFDVARKLLILAREAWYNAEMKNIEVKPFIDEKYWDSENEKLIGNIDELDNYFSDLYKSAKQKGMTLKYVASFVLWDDWSILLEVKLKEVFLNSQIGNLKGSGNIVVLETEELYPKENPFVFGKPWAWPKVTTQAILKDVKKIMEIYNLLEKNKRN